MKRCVGEYREEIICIVVPRHEVAWELDADYIGEGCYDYHNHLWYDDGTYMRCYSSRFIKIIK